MSLCYFRAQAGDEWYHCCTPEKGIGSFLGEMSGAVHNVSVDSHALTDINVCCIIAHRSPPVYIETSEDSQNESDEENVSIPSDPKDLVKSLEQHLLDSRKRRLEAERKVEELSEENERLRKELTSF